MKKLLIVIGVMLLIYGVFVFYNKLYYPPLPIENLSKKEALDKLNDSDEQIVHLSNENNYEWYIINERNMASADEMIEELVSENGWVFKQKDGAGLFFEKQGNRLIVTTQKWTGDYVLVQIPSNFNH